MKVVIIGGGWSGCAAAISAKKQGAQVILLERTDMLLGTGLVGGIMRNNGRFTATEECLAMGGKEIFNLIDQNYLHRDIEFPGHKHASLYNVATMEPIVRDFLLKKGIEIRFATRIDNVVIKNDHIEAVTARIKGNKVRFEGDVFVETTGTAGGPVNCTKYGNGCAMCILRCPSFGSRVSIAAKCGITEMVGRKGDHIGAMSGSCKLLKESLSREVADTLDKEGVAVIPIPPSMRNAEKLAMKACQQYALPEFLDNIILLNTGHAKLMTSYIPLDSLRQVPGMECARYEDPYAGGLGNSIRYIGMSPRDDALKVLGVENLFCAGEKAGLLVGHTEAIITGTLAGYNAAKQAKKEKPLVLPPALAIGDAIAYVRDQMATEEGLGYKYTFSGSVYFERMRENNFYTTDINKIRKRVDEAGLTDIFS
ncbi:MAG: FAD-dependent oxidoreductase [Proteobacteria bacterium]|nr:FAD-dependent oxidoreductase [Pseudomonadota bacterium]